MKTDFACLFSGLLIALVSCQQDTTDLPPTEENLSGDWEYLGSWENGKLQQDTFAEAIIDDFNKTDTIIAAEEGTIELVHKDTVRIQWNHGSTTKFKRAVLTSNY